MSATAITSLVACGSSKPPDPSTPQPPATGAPTTPSPADSTASAPPDAKPADKYALAEQAPNDDPNEVDGKVQLKALVAKGAPKSQFPKQTVADHACLKEIAVSGNHKTDFQTIIDKCGTPTGMVEYTKPHEGHLHHKKDKRDEFLLSVNKGMCYRYFAVGDDGIKDIDIIVLKKGALLATDKTDSPISIINSEDLWCMDEDMDLDFSVEVDGGGAGGYMFGVWTRPKK